MIVDAIISPRSALLMLLPLAVAFSGRCDEPPVPGAAPRLAPTDTSQPAADKPMPPEGAADKPASQEPPAEDSGPPELVTDRPDQTESAVTIPPGSVQLEIGASRVSNHESQARRHVMSVLETLIRVGVTRRTELRLIHDGYAWETTKESGTAAATEDGAGDMALGGKVRLWDEAGLRPEAAILAHLSLPVGRRGFSSERLDPSFRASFAHTLTERISLGYNLGMAWASVPGEMDRVRTAPDFEYTAVLGFDLTERLGAFAEVFGGIPISGTGGPAHSVDFGLTFLLLKNLQLDGAVGFGLSNAADDHFMTIGVSYRLPR